MSGEEIAIRFNIKLQLVRDLVKSLNKKSVLFLNKKKEEIKIDKQKAAISSSMEAAFVSKRTIWSSK